MLVAYGGAMISGASSAFMINKIVSVRNLALYILFECECDDDLDHL